MPENDAQTVIRRMLSPPVGPFDGTGMNLAKIFRLAVVRAVEEHIGMELLLPGFVEERTSLGQVVQDITGTDLIFATHGPRGSVGLALLDGDGVAAFIEHIITGRVVPRTGADRKPTRTDAAVISGVVNAISLEFEKGLGQVKKAPPISGFRTAGLFEDGRAVSLSLDDVPYRTIRLTLDTGPGVKAANLRLIYPWDRVSAAKKGRGSDANWSKDWARAVGQTHVSLEAILVRMPLPLAVVTGFKVGDLVPVPAWSVGQVIITGSDRKQVGRGRLGQSNGFRAVRIQTAKPGTAPQDAMPAPDPAPTEMPGVPVDLATT